MNAVALTKRTEVRIADLADPRICARIDAFVAEHPDGTFFHRPHWSRAVERGTGHPSLYLVAERAGALAGCLPLSRIRSRLFGNALVSAGFATGGGILAENETIAERLADHAWRLAEQDGLRTAELRGGPVPAGWHEATGTYAAFTRALPATGDQLLASIPRRQRAEVRRGLEFGLELSHGTDRRHRDAFFRVYAESVRNLGTPVFPRRLFEAALDEFGGQASIDLAARDGRPLAAMLSFDFGRICQPYWGGGTREARTWRGNDLIYYEVMRRAIERGCDRADFGRSKIGTGPWARKRIWGFDETPLVYAVRSADGAEPRAVNPLDPRYRLKIAAWQKLPLFVANRLGPVIARGLG